MSDKESQRQTLIDKRARALATMLLTRRDDLRIEEVTDDPGLDYIVRFRARGKEGLREFGVQLCGAWEAVTKDHADRALRPRLQQLKRHGPFLRPVCLFFFTMEDDGAWYTWVAEPVRSEDGRSQLRFAEEPDCQPLDRKALKEIIERVDSWYEVLFPSLVANGPGAGKAEHKHTQP